MANEIGHHTNRVFIDQNGDLILNGAKMRDANANDLSTMLTGLTAGTVTASKILLADANKALDTLTIAALTTTTDNIVAGASTAAAGTTTADAGVLPAHTSSVYPTTGADGTKGVRIDVTDKVSGTWINIGNGVANQTLKVYAPSGGTINGGSADAAFVSVSGKGVSIYCLSGAGNTWLAW